jgi:biopolymer transport protein ExbD
VSITLGSDGRLAVDERAVRLEELRDVIGERLAETGNPEVLVVVRADSDASYDQVQDLLTSARAAGAKRLAIATRQRMEGVR